MTTPPLPPGPDSVTGPSDPASATPSRFDQLPLSPATLANLEQLGYRAMFTVP